jgi:Skp family chaperone for outer membrane proteins
MFFLVGGFAALIMGAVGSSYLFATGPTAVQQQPAATKVGVVNIGQVFNQYNRAKAFKAELEATLAPHKKRAKELTDHIKACEDFINSGKCTNEQRDQYADAIKKTRRQLEDMSVEIQKSLGTKQEQNLVTLWKEVNLGIKAVAQSQGYSLIIGYGDPMEKELMDAFPNVNRKMQAMDLGGSTPLYMHDSVDISNIVVHNLNLWTKDKVQPVSGTK